MCIALLSSAYALPTPYGQPDNVYSADVYGSTMFMSGWITAADVGPDQLLVSPTGEVAPTPIAFTNGNPYATYHLADPSVVAGPNGSLLMFATALDNGDATASGDGGHVQLWYGIGNLDTLTGLPETPTIITSTMSADGRSLEGSQQCIDTTTGQALQGYNSDVYQEADRTFLMVLNNFLLPSVGDILAYTS